MKKLLSYFVFAFLTFGIGAIFWSAISLGNSSYAFWKNGRETTAVVLSLDHVSGSAKGGNSYYYNLNVDGQKITQSFRFKLSEGSTYKILLLDEKREAILGTSEDGLFEIYSAQIGSDFMAILTLLMFIFMPYGTYKMYSELWPKRHDLWRKEY